MKTLNKILTKNLIVFSNIDEDVLRKAQQWEQEEMHKYFSYGIETELPENKDIAKTLMSGSSWMK
jgi:hypothetical protein